MTQSNDGGPGDTSRPAPTTAQSPTSIDQPNPSIAVLSTTAPSDGRPTAAQARPEQAPAPPSAAPTGGHRSDRVTASDAPTAATGETWVVGQGDSFWSVAVETLADRARGGAPTDGEVERYWRALVDANRAEMADPANPDLLIPGQELALPPT